MEEPANKKPKINHLLIPVQQTRNYTVGDLGLQVEVLQEELIAAKEEIRTLRVLHRRELDYLYLFFYSLFIIVISSSSASLVLH